MKFLHIKKEVCTCYALIHVSNAFQYKKTKQTCSLNRKKFLVQTTLRHIE